jgi:hypothetical protein
MRPAKRAYDAAGKAYETAGCAVGPSGNCFVVGTQDSFRLEAVQSSVRRIRLHALLDGSRAHEQETVYDRFGMKWGLAEVRSRWTNSWYGPLLARIAINPLIEVQVSWRKPQPYGLDELKATFLRALDQEGQPPGQGVAATRLKTRIREAQTFDELADAHRSVAAGATGKAAAVASAR